MENLKAKLKEYHFYKVKHNIEKTYLWWNKIDKKYIVTINFSKEFWNSFNEFELIK